MSPGDGGQSESAAVLRLRAHAKINLDLQVLGRRPDGYHELRTVFQSLALHDRISLSETSGGLSVDCRVLESAAGGVFGADREALSGSDNLVWKAAALLWEASGRSGPPAGVRIELEKRIPLQAGLGGGSADAAVTLLGLVRLWRLTVSGDELAAAARRLGADVPFFLSGGTARGTGRGDLIEPLEDERPWWVVLVFPPFGLGTAEVYGWFAHGQAAGSPGSGGADPAGRAATCRGRNDLEAAVMARHPELGVVKRDLLAAGASVAAMSGSGSTLFGLFEDRPAARRAAEGLRRRGQRALLTRTLSRSEYEASVWEPNGSLAPFIGARIH